MAFVRLIGSFLASTVVSGVVTAAIVVYWLRSGDAKFRDAPSAAFELEVWSLLVICLIAIVVMTVVGLFLNHRLSASPRTMALAALWGIAYPVLHRPIFAPLAQVLDTESLLFPILACLYLVAFPALAIFTLREVRPRAEHAL